MNLGRTCIESATLYQQFHINHNVITYIIIERINDIRVSYLQKRKRLQNTFISMNDCVFRVSTVLEER